MMGIVDNTEYLNGQLADLYGLTLGETDYESLNDGDKVAFLAGYNEFTEQQVQREGSDKG